MTIDVFDLVMKNRTGKEIELTYNEESFFDGTEEIKFVSPVHFSGQVTSSADLLILNGIVNTELELNCSRCLDKFNYPLQLIIEEKFTVSPENEDEDVSFIEGEKIDLTTVVQNSIMLTLPIQRLCKHDCKGLCLTCGSNLNKTKCNCYIEDVDPRLAKLKDFFMAD